MEQDINLLPIVSAQVDEGRRTIGGLAQAAKQEYQDYKQRLEEEHDNKMKEQQKLHQELGRGMARVDDRVIQNLAVNQAELAETLKRNVGEHFDAESHPLVKQARENLSKLHELQGKLNQLHEMIFKAKQQLRQNQGVLLPGLSGNPVAA